MFSQSEVRPRGLKNFADCNDKHVLSRERGLSNRVVDSFLITLNRDCTAPLGEIKIVLTEIAKKYQRVLVYFSN